MLRFPAIVIAVLALGGCMSLTRQDYLGATADPADYAAITASIEREADAHKQIVNIRAPAAYYKTDISDGSYFLRAARDNEGRIINLQIYIHAIMSDWAFLDRAWSNGERLEVTQISRRVGGCYYGFCSVSEDVAINLTADDLVECSERGLSAKVEGNRGSVVVNIPPAYFKAFRDALTR